MRVGDRVQVIWLASVIHHRGVIHAINENGTFDIIFADGTEERSVPADRIHPIGSTGEASVSDRGERTIKWPRPVCILSLWGLVLID